MFGAKLLHRLLRLVLLVGLLPMSNHMSYMQAKYMDAAMSLLNPILAAAAMAFSSVFVVSNSLKLRRVKI